MDDIKETMQLTSPIIKHCQYCGHPYLKRNEEELSVDFIGIMVKKVLL
jgi:hypothetical protein